jgi:hypothetical protein
MIREHKCTKHFNFAPKWLSGAPKCTKTLWYQKLRYNSEKGLHPFGWGFLFCFPIWKTRTHLNAARVSATSDGSMAEAFSGVTEDLLEVSQWFEAHRDMR